MPIMPLVLATPYDLSLTVKSIKVSAFIEGGRATSIIRWTPSWTHKIDPFSSFCSLTPLMMQTIHHPSVKNNPYHTFFLNKYVIHPGGGGHWPRKGVWGCAALKTPFSHLSCHSQGSHFKQKSQFTRPPFEKIWEILASTTSIFTQILAHKPPNLEIFRSQAPKFGNFQLTSPQIWKFSTHKPPFSERQMSVHKPHSLEIRPHTPTWKKVECPPGYPPCNGSSPLVLFTLDASDQSLVNQSIIHSYLAKYFSD